MALTKLITKAFPGANHVGLHLLLKDADVVILDRDYMEQWDGSSKMSVTVIDIITKRMQTDIDAYKKLKGRFDEEGDNTAVISVTAVLKV